MRRIFVSILTGILMLMPVFSSAQSKGSERVIVLGSEITPKDTTKARRFKNRLILPKGDWQCGLSVMYAGFNSANSDYMLVLQGLSANASMLRIAPEAAFTFKDNHSIGVRFQYTKAGGMLDSMTADVLGNLSLPLENVGAETLSMGASVFQRTYVGIDKRGRFGIYWDYILGYTRSTTEFGAGGNSGPFSVKQKAHLGFAPGVIYFPMNNVSVHVGICVADLSYNYITGYENGTVTGTRRAWKAQASLNVLDLNFGLTIHL